MCILRILLLKSFTQVIEVVNDYCFKSFSYWLIILSACSDVYVVNSYNFIFIEYVAS